jgi:hypothetical protein
LSRKLHCRSRGPLLKRSMTMNAGTWTFRGECHFRSRVDGRR